MEQVKTNDVPETILRIRPENTKVTLSDANIIFIPVPVELKFCILIARVLNAKKAENTFSFVFLKMF